MKRTLALLLVFALFVSLNTGAFVANASYDQKYQLEDGMVIKLNDTTVTFENAEIWAYKDYSTATKSERTNILKARSIMMQKTDWVADGFIGYYTAPDGTVEEMPSFSEVFPDWDIEQIWAYNNKVDALTEQVTASETLDLNTVVFPQYFDCDIPVATDEYAPLAHITSMDWGTGNYRTTVQSLTTCTTCNIGYKLTNGGTTTDVGFKENIPVDGDFSVYFSGVSYLNVLRVRVSTYSTAGSGSFELSID